MNNILIFKAITLLYADNKKASKSVLRLLVGGNLVCILFSLTIYWSDESFTREVIAIISYMFFFLICNGSVMLSMRRHTHIVTEISLNNSGLQILASALLWKKTELISLDRSYISLSKGTFEWRGKWSDGRGIIIRDKKSKKEYYIIEAYFDEYDKLVEQLKS